MPFYNLRKVHMALRPLYAQLGLKPHTYREIVWQWFVLNRAPHTNWELAEAPAGPPAPGGGSTHDDELIGDRNPTDRPSVPPAQIAARVALR